MTSANKIRANRANAKQSTGPKSANGKKRASRNARKHGLSAIGYGSPSFSKEAEQMVAAICVGDSNPLVLEQATIIAESELALRMVRQQKTAVIERLFNPFAVALMKGDKRAAMGEILLKQAKIADDERTQLVRKFEKEGVEYYPLFTPADIPPDQPVERYEPPQLRTEHEAVCGALPDLERMLRYERRILSRQRKAIEAFSWIKVSDR